MRTLIRQLSKYKQSGFTLAEGMVTAGLLGIVSLAMLQGLKQDSASKQLMRYEDEIQAVMKTINSNLKDTASCTRTFGPLGTGAPFDVPTSGSWPITILRDSNGDKLMYRNPTTGANISIEEAQPITGGDTFDNANLVLYKMRVANFKEFFRFEENLGQGGGTGIQEMVYGMVEFEVDFRRRFGTGKSRTDQIIVRSLNLTVKGIEVGGKIRLQGCANQSDVTALQLKQRVCAQMVQVGGGGEVMVGSYNPQTGTCGGIIEGLNETATDLICEEMGGYLTPDSSNPGTYKCAVFPPSIPNCLNGIRAFGNDGRPICI